ncbi:MAG: RNA polymerase sigma factor [Oscillospiraceae bacterium]|nr:RNA polymerase sigma factor [Oscillospiraceae bacterium]
MDDEQIISLCISGDERALAAIWESYGGRLQRLAMTFLGNASDAEECVSETYYQAWRAIRTAKPAHLYAYLAKICRYTAFGMLDHQRAQKRSAELVELTAEMEQSIPDSLPDAAEEHLSEVLNHFLAALPPEKRSIFLRRYWYGESIAELAAALHCKEGRIKTLLHRLRKSLRTELEKEGIQL